MLQTVTLHHTRPAETGPTPRENNAGRTLVTAARQGDRRAFAELHHRYAPVVHGILLARVPVQEAEDLVQDVFLHAMRKLPTLREADAFGPWLIVIARRFAVQFHRRQRKASDLPADLIADDHLCKSDGSMNAQACEVLAVIRSMPEAYRETLILRLVEGLTGPHIAACTGRTAASVRVNLHRGMTLLRARLGANATRRIVND